MPKSHVYLAALLHYAPKESTKDLSYDTGYIALIERAAELVLGEKPVPVKENQLLASVFEEILVDNHNPSFFYQPTPFSLSEDDFFPETQAELQKRKKTLEKLAEQIEQAEQIKVLSKTDDSNRAENILALYKKYTPKLHCGFEGHPTISFYDFAKSLAGIAVSLHEGEAENPEVPLLLIGGDLSGIQDFIYDIVSKTAAKNLKGRSFYLQLLIQSILHRLLGPDYLDLFRCNVVYDSGGGFNLIAPNTERVRTALEDFRALVNERLFDEHKTLLSLTLTSVPIKLDELRDKVGEIQASLKTKLGEQKHTKHLAEVKAYEALFGDGVEQGGTVPRDVVTGEEIGLEEPIFKYRKAKLLPYKFEDFNPEQDLGPIKQLTGKQIELGQKLKSLDYWVIATESLAGENDFLQEVELNPCNLGVYNYLLPANIYKKNQNTIHSKAKKVIFINDFEKQGIPQAFDYGLYGGNEFPTDGTESPKTFSEMAGAIEEDKLDNPDYKPQELPFKRLGILRMDVDDLGYIFKEGFKKESLSFAKYSTLSRSMDAFFKGYINTIWSTLKDLSDNSQIIYAGGDDLFAVGRWDLMIDFAEAIQQNFRDWTCGNPKLSISGGLTIVTHKYPIMKAARMAGSQEKKAKDHQQKPGEFKDDDLQKKSFSLLGLPLHWAEQDGWINEYQLVKAMKTELLEFIDGKDGKKLSHGFLQKVMRLEAMRIQWKKSEDEKEAGKIDHAINPKWQWTTAYYFSKTAKEYERSNKELARYLQQKSQQVIFNQEAGQPLQSPHRFLTLFALAARWAELERRQTQALNSISQNP